MADLEVINFHGLGNDTRRQPDDCYHVNQRQWLFEPAVAFALGPRASDSGFLVEANTSAFPRVWDVERTFAQFSATATTFFRLPLPAHPVLAARRETARVGRRAERGAHSRRQRRSRARRRSAS